MAKKLKNETALLNEALRLVMEDAVRRKIVEFEATLPAPGARPKNCAAPTRPAENPEHEASTRHVGDA
jgi:hypothetical protein